MNKVVYADGTQEQDHVIVEVVHRRDDIAALDQGATAILLRLHAFGQCQLSVNQFDEVRNVETGQVADQPVAAMRPLLGLHEPGGAEYAHHVRQGIEGSTVLVANLAHGCKLIRGLSLHVLQGNEAILDLPVDLEHRRFSPNGAAGVQLPILFESEVLSMPEFIMTVLVCAMNVEISSEFLKNGSSTKGLSLIAVTLMLVARDGTCMSSDR